MLLGSIQVRSQQLTEVDIEEMTTALHNNEVRHLSVRQCHLKERDYRQLTTAVGHCKSLLQLNFNLNIVCTLERAKILQSALSNNRSLRALFLHGTPLGLKGLSVLVSALLHHPNIVSLDIGDCHLNNACIPLVTDLLPSHGAKTGLKELTLSGNTDITPLGWGRFCIALATNCCLQTLHLDYNHVRDYGTGCLTVALASNTSLELVDLEGTEITEMGAKNLLHLVENYPVTIKQLILDDNPISKNTIKTIKKKLLKNATWNHEGSNDKMDISQAVSMSSNSNISNTSLEKSRKKQVQFSTSESESERDSSIEDSESTYSSESSAEQVSKEQNKTPYVEHKKQGKSTISSQKEVSIKLDKFNRHSLKSKSAM